MGLFALDQTSQAFLVFLKASPASVTRILFETEVVNTKSTHNFKI
jgi:hypothetical protein